MLHGCDRRRVLPMRPTCAL